MQVIDMINSALAEKRTRFTLELLPPLKGEGAGVIFNALDPLMEFDPAYINVTFHREDVSYVPVAGGQPRRCVVRKRPGTVGISAAIKGRYGVEAVPHLICGGVSRYEIEDALIDMEFLGLENVLALQGDALKDEPGFTPHPEGHNYAAQLVAQIADLNRGRLIDGPAPQGVQKFCVGVAGYPETHLAAASPDDDLARLKQKIDAGADYIVTQMCFDNRRIFDFIARCRAAGITVPIIPGIKPLSTRAQLEALPRIFGVTLPDELVREAGACADNNAIRELGIRWATAQAQELKRAHLPVIHFYTMNRSEGVVRILKEL